MTQSSYDTVKEKLQKAESQIFYVCTETKDDKINELSNCALKNVREALAALEQMKAAPMREVEGLEQVLHDALRNHYNGVTVEDARKIWEAARLYSQGQRTTTEQPRIAPNCSCGQQPKAVPDGWTDPHDKNQSQWLPWIKERVFFQTKNNDIHEGYHTGGSWFAYRGMRTIDNERVVAWIYPRPLSNMLAAPKEGEVMFKRLLKALRDWATIRDYGCVNPIILDGDKWVRTYLSGFGWAYIKVGRKFTNTEKAQGE